ncbi:50S ribosomal protein L21 [bacterium]|nr:50S ribosomal protein L21 [bacterium]
MLAVVETGGKQYKVKENDIIEVEKLDSPEGVSITLDKVLFVDTGSEHLIGSPYLTSARVIAKVLQHFKGEKIRVFKYRAKKNYRRRKGHRQQLTRLLIEKIEIGGD